MEAALVTVIVHSRKNSAVRQNLDQLAGLVQELAVVPHRAEVHAHVSGWATESLEERRRAGEADTNAPTRFAWSRRLPASYLEDEQCVKLLRAFARRRQQEVIHIASELERGGSDEYIKILAVYLRAVSQRRQGNFGIACQSVQRALNRGIVEDEWRAAFEALHATILLDVGRTEQALSVATGLWTKADRSHALDYILQFVESAALFKRGQYADVYSRAFELVRQPDMPEDLRVRLVSIGSVAALEVGRPDEAIILSATEYRFPSNPIRAIIYGIEAHAELRLGRLDRAYQASKRSVYLCSTGTTGAVLRDLVWMFKVDPQAPPFPDIEGFSDPAKGSINTTGVAGSPRGILVFPIDDVHNNRVRIAKGVTNKDWPRMGRRAFFHELDKLYSPEKKDWFGQMRKQFLTLNNEAESALDTWDAAQVIRVFTSQFIHSRPSMARTDPAHRWGVLLDSLDAAFAELDWGALPHLPVPDVGPKDPIPKIDAAAAATAVSAFYLAAWGRDKDAEALVRASQERLDAAGNVGRWRSAWLHLSWAALGAYFGEDPAQPLHQFVELTKKTPEPPHSLVRYLLRCYPRRWVPAFTGNIMHVLSGERRVGLLLETAIACSSIDADDVSRDLISLVDSRDLSDCSLEILTDYREAAEIYGLNVDCGRASQLEDLNGEALHSWTTAEVEKITAEMVER
jgi:tetratricopeptide (TPR) repeat protein